MSTNAQIVTQVNGQWRSIRVHFDGDRAGKLLVTYHNTQEAVDTLMALGNICSLGFSNNKPEGHSWRNPVPGHTVFYGRDRGDRAQGARLFDTTWGFKGDTEYTWVWKGGAWHLGTGNGCYPLGR